MKDPVPSLGLKWRRSYSDSDQHFRALDPVTYGEVRVLNIIRNKSDTGTPADWHWILLAPGLGGREGYPGPRQGDAATVREAAAAGEAAYQAFRAWITPEALERANRHAQNSLAGNRQWARLNGRAA